MSDNKKYYYIRLKDNFFDSDEIIILESMPDGHLYSNILLKFYLRSLKYEGKLMFNNRIPYNSTILAQVTRHSVGVIEKAVKIFEELGLVTILDNGAMYMLDIQNFIGKSSTEADRLRIYRKEIEKEKTKLLTENKEGVQMYVKCTPEIEIEKELEKELEIEREIVKKISSLWSSNGFGSLNKDLLDKLLEDVTIYSLEWVLDSIKVGNDRSKRSYSYIKGILNNWQTEGRNKEVKKDGGDKQHNSEQLKEQGIGL